MRQSNTANTIVKCRELVDACKKLPESEYHARILTLSKQYGDLGLLTADILGKDLYYTAINRIADDKIVYVVYDLVWRKEDLHIGKLIEVHDRKTSNLIYAQYMFDYIEEILEIDILSKDLDSYSKSFVQQVVEAIDKNYKIAVIEESMP